MPRVLRMTERSVAAESVPRYREALAAMAASVEARGGHFWVFVRRDDAGRYLEFTEASDRFPRDVRDDLFESRVAAFSSDRAESWWNAFPFAVEE